MTRLAALPSAQFSHLVYALGVSSGVLSADSSPQLQRAVELVRFFDQPGHNPSMIEVALEGIAPARGSIHEAAKHTGAPLSVLGSVSPAPTNSPASATSAGIDVLIVTAVKEEYEEALNVNDGALDVWRHDTGPTGFDVAFRSYRAANGPPIRVALTRALEMREVAAANAAWPLIHEYKPRCLAMCGVCAGRRGETNLGDVIVGDILYTYDTGAVVVEYGADGKHHERWKGEPSPYRLDGRWKQRAESVVVAPDTEWLKTRPLSLEAQGNWLLERLLAGDTDPAKHPERGARCPAWKQALARLRKLKLVTSSGLTLTAKGRAHVEESLLLHPDGRPPQPPFRIRVAPIATGSNVVRDEHIFERLSESMRKVLGVEMEAAAIGAIAHVSDIRMLVMKGVMDHADEDKDDGFKAFAARASAECLIWFLRENMSR